MDEKDKMLEQNFEFYKKNQSSLVKKYNGKTLVIHNEEVVRAFSDYDEAYFFAMDSFDEGTFLLQLCSPGAEAYTQTFHSRVVI